MFGVQWKMQRKGKKPVSEETHPVQNTSTKGVQCRASKKITMRAYEVYCKIYGPQEAMVTGWCRGGFSAGELITFLYVRSFPEEEWQDRYAEVVTENL